MADKKTSHTSIRCRVARYHFLKALSAPDHWRSPTTQAAMRSHLT